MQVTCVHNTISTLDEDSAERKQLEEILSTSGLPPLATIQGLCSSTTTNGSLHASPNTTPQPTPPGTPSSIRKLAKLTQQSEYMFLNTAEVHSQCWILSEELILIINCSVWYSVLL